MKKVKESDRKDKYLSIRLDKPTNQLLRDFAKSTGKKKSELVREILDKYCDKILDGEEDV